MLDAARIDLSKYRLERAEEMLKTARRDLDAGDYASANNRAYYCVFHAMRATLALTGEDYKKHSGVISRFSEQYLKTRLLPPELSRIISMASIIRNRSVHFRHKEAGFGCGIVSGHRYGVSGNAV